MDDITRGARTPETPATVRRNRLVTKRNVLVLIGIAAFLGGLALVDRWFDANICTGPAGEQMCQRGLIRK